MALALRRRRRYRFLGTDDVHGSSDMLRFGIESMDLVRPPEASCIVVLILGLPLCADAVVAFFVAVQGPAAARRYPRCIVAVDMVSVQCALTQLALWALRPVGVNARRSCEGGCGEIWVVRVAQGRVDKGSSQGNTETTH
jgi:hypothetical protein